MNCKEAGNFIMKYMDKILTEEEALKLNFHILDCENCKNDFFMYSLIMSEFDNIKSIIEPPEDFELNVIEKIRALEEDVSTAISWFEYVLCFIWSVFSFTAFGVTFLVINKSRLIEYFSANAAYSGFVDAINAVSEYLSLLMDSVAGIFYGFSNAFAGFIEATQYFSLTVIIAAVVIQLFVYIYKKDKVEVR